MEKERWISRREAAELVDHVINYVIESGLLYCCRAAIVRNGVALFIKGTKIERRKLKPFRCPELDYLVILPTEITGRIAGSWHFRFTLFSERLTLSRDPIRSAVWEGDG